MLLSANHVAAKQCIKSCRYRSRASVHVHIEHQYGEKCDVRDFELFGARWSGISETDGFLGFSYTTVPGVLWSKKWKTSCEQQFCKWKHFVDEKTQRRMVRPVGADRRATVTQITTLYNHGEQKSSSEWTARPTLRSTGHDSRRPRLAPLLSAKNRSLRLQWRQPQQNWTVEDWKNDAWSDESNHWGSSTQPALCQQSRLLSAI